MKRMFILSVAACLASGCASQLVEHNANESCAKQGKKAFLFDSKQAGIPLLIESASVMVLCVGPDDVIHLPATFGADAVSAANFHGAGIASVIPGSAADKAGVKANDIVVEFAGRSIDRATDLRVALDSMSPGDQATIKMRRIDGKDATVTAHFGPL